MSLLLFLRGLKPEIMPKTFCKVFSDHPLIIVLSFFGIQGAKVFSFIVFREDCKLFLDFFSAKFRECKFLYDP